VLRLDHTIKVSFQFSEDYKYFITEVGNGGAGPYYGLFPFGEQDCGRGFCAWEGGGLVGDLSQVFPHTTAWNLPESFWQLRPNPPAGIALEEEDRLNELWDKELQEHYWNLAIMNGAIPICHLGCALRQWLVIQGQQKGYVWGDDRVDNRGIYPLRDRSGQGMTLSRWYLAWLHEACTTLGIS
jgi:hypothetical protein